MVYGGGRLVHGLLIVAVIFAVFFQVYQFSFVTLDDAVHVSTNSLIQTFSFSDLYRLLESPYQGLYIPLTYLFWAFQVVLVQTFISGPGAELDPTLFHLVNLSIHAINALLVYGILVILIRHRIAALVGAIFFALHPLQVEPVAWISALKDLLSSMFGLLAVWIALGLKPGWINLERECLKYLGATVCFVLALLSKPSAVVLPLFVLILYWMSGQRKLKEALITALPWIVLSLPFMLLTKLGQPDFIVDNKIPLLWRPLVAADAIIFYLSKMVFPFSLGLNYGRSPDLLVGKWWLFHLWLIPLLLWLIFRRRPSTKYWFVALALVVAYLIPVLGFIPFYYQKYSTVADRFCYLALLGPATVIAWFYTRYQGKTARVLMVLYLGFLGVRSFDQLQHWQSNEAMITRTSQINPNADVFYSLGFMFSKQGRREEAITQYQKALQYDPSHFSSHNNLALLFAEKNRMREAEFYLQKAFKLSPGNSSVANNLGGVLLSLGRVEEARKSFIRAIQLGEFKGDAHFNLATLFQREGKWKEALKWYRKSVELDPGNKKRLKYLSNAEALEKQFKKGVKKVQKNLHLHREWEVAKGNSPSKKDNP